MLALNNTKATQVYRTKPTRTCMLNLAIAITITITITITQICLSSLYSLVATITCLQNGDGDLKS
jgi:hypothetical protein